MSASTVLEQLIAARLWLQIVIDKLDLEPETTSVDVSAVMPSSGEKRPLAKITLAQSLARMDEVIAAEKARAA